MILFETYCFVHQNLWYPPCWCQGGMGKQNWINEIETKIKFPSSTLFNSPVAAIHDHSSRSELRQGCECWLKLTWNSEYHHTSLSHGFLMSEALIIGSSLISSTNNQSGRRDFLKLKGLLIGDNLLIKHEQMWLIRNLIMKSSGKSFAHMIGMFAWLILYVWILV